MESLIYFGEQVSSHFIFPYDEKKMIQQRLFIVLK